jgi:hypothetical protein
LPLASSRSRVATRSLSRKRLSFLGKRAMSKSILDEKHLKKALKEALVETLEEKRELLLDVFAELFEDLAMLEAIREGKKTKKISREEVFRTLQGKS